MRNERERIKINDDQKRNGKTLDTNGATTSYNEQDR